MTYKTNNKIKDTLKGIKGIADHSGSLRVQFRLPGEKKSTRKSIGLATTLHNIKIAEQKLDAIKLDIFNRTYDNDPKFFWRKHFPNDMDHVVSNKTVSDYLLYYFQRRDGELDVSSKNKLKSIKSWLIKHKLFNINIHELQAIDIETAIKNSYVYLKQSTVDDYLTQFKKIVKEAVNDETIATNPFDRVRKIRQDRMFEEDKVVIPFSKTELAKLLSVIHIEQTRDMVDLLAWTGMRPGELKALAWEDVDLDKETISVKYNIDREGKLKPPKTFASIRTIELLPKAIEVLERQLTKTFELPTHLETAHYKYNKTRLVERHRVFLSRGNKPYKRPELTTAPGQWKNWLLKANLDHRPPYQLRHTFASRMLMVGGDKSWLATQLGHTNTKMLDIIYGKWIPKEKPTYKQDLIRKLNEQI